MYDLLCYEMHYVVHCVMLYGVLIFLSAGRCSMDD